MILLKTNMSFNDEQIQFLNKFLVRLYNCDIKKDAFDWQDERSSSWEERMEDEYDNDMKTYFQKAFIDEAEFIGYMLSTELIDGKAEFTTEYQLLFREFGEVMDGMPEPNIIRYCESLDLEKLFIILEEAIGTDLFELYDMYDIDYAQPK